MGKSQISRPISVNRRRKWLSRQKSVAVNLRHVRAGGDHHKATSITRGSLSSLAELFKLPVFVSMGSHFQGLEARDYHPAELLKNWIPTNN